MDHGKITTSGVIGIDAGGTFTDLVFYSGADGAILAKTKTPTKHDDLVSTIKNGIEAMLREVDAQAVTSVNLATTLATNAIVEDKLRPTAIFLIGYPEDTVAQARKRQTFGTGNLIRIPGGHDAWGNEREPFGEAELMEEIGNLDTGIQSVAVSGYFAVRNTTHENRAMQLIQECRPEVYVTCGHELATDLDAIKRATTCGLNAGLIPIVMELLDSVENVCMQMGMDVPIMVVRGDGSLVGADWAKLHPVEMILSGPAASACGAHILAGAGKLGRASWAVDMGGTTTDIIRLDKEGRPVLMEKGANVAGHRTLVKAIDIYTFGLGGDSRVTFDSEHRLILGPRRVISLCVLAQEYPEIIPEMQKWKLDGYVGEPLFILRGQGQPEGEFENRIMGRLADGRPRLVPALLDEEEMPRFRREALEVMEAQGYVQFASFTPTDALHVLGLLDLWERKASIAGAAMYLADWEEESPGSFSERVRDQVVRMITSALFRKSISKEGLVLEKDGEGQKLIDMSLSQGKEGQAGIYLRLNAVLIGAGAPAWAFVPRVGEQLQETSVIEEDADVAGAVGAAAGSFLLVYAIRINPNEEGYYRVHHPMGCTDYGDLEQAVEETCDKMLPWVEERARRAGAFAPQVTWSREDRAAWVNGSSKKLHLWTQLTFTVSDGKEPFAR